VIKLDSKTKNNTHIKIQKPDTTDSSNSKEEPDKGVEEIKDLCDENLKSIQKIHAILLNCVNLSKKQKFEFCESERYFMKLYLKKLRKLNDST